VIPVEVKSGRAPSGGPYASHILQLAAYCLLVEEKYGQSPPYGLILFSEDTDKAYEIDYTEDLRRSLLDRLDEMRRALADGTAPRNHQQAARCQACNYRSACDEALA
jgi:CRISPR-associated exonuclease Cas4